MGDYSYQTLQIDNRVPPTGGPSARGQGVGAGVKLLHKASVALNQLAVSVRVNRELQRLSPEIDRLMPRSGGVLVCVGTQEWERPDPTGSRAQMFMELHIAGAGADPGTVLRAYQAQPRLVQGPPQGWRRRDVFIWVTRRT